MSGPYKVCEDVYMIGDSEISHPMDCCVYLVDAGELVLIDAGAQKSANRLIDNMVLMGLLPEKLSTVIATHAHIDHVGSLDDLKKRYNVKIIAHEFDTNSLETGNKVGAEYYGIDYTPVDIDIKLQGRENTLLIGSYEFTFNHIPGHTPGSMAVLITTGNNRVLFGQDIHGPYQAIWGGEPAEAIKSLEKLLAIKADILCEGHYGVIRPGEEVEAFIRSFLDDLHTRK